MQDDGLPGRPPPWEVPPPWVATSEASNPAARWALGLGIASVVPGIGLGAVVAGVLGLVRARAARGAGRRLAAVGLALGAGFLLVDVAAVGVGAAHAATTWFSSIGGTDGGYLPDPDRRSGGDLSAEEQDYVDALADVTYLNFDDETLVEMGRQSCSDLSQGMTPDEDSARLGEDFGAGVGDAWDVQRAATATLCPENADALRRASGAGLRT